MEETLEQAAQRFKEGNYLTMDDREVFIEGAKWQAYRINQLCEEFKKLTEEPIEDVDELDFAFSNGKKHAYSKAWLEVKKILDSVTDVKYMYTKEEVKALLETQRGNSYVAILREYRNKEIAKVALNAPEPAGGKWVKE